MLEAIDFSDAFNLNVKKLDSQMGELIFARTTIQKR